MCEVEGVGTKYHQSVHVCVGGGEVCMCVCVCERERERESCCSFNKLNLTSLLFSNFVLTE